MSIAKKTLLIIIMITIALMTKAPCLAYEYTWPIGGENAEETYTDYSYYGKAYSAPYKNGKSGREYVVNNSLWPDEEFYYISCESNYGVDITGIYGHEYNVVSVSNGTVIATSNNRAKDPSTDYPDRNKRRSYDGITDGCGYGNYVIIQEEATGRCFLYAHLKGGTISVSKGEAVASGQTIGIMGSSGDSGHMNLHFEIRKQKDLTLVENENQNHFLIIANSNTNVDPENYIGKKDRQETTDNEDDHSNDFSEQENIKHVAIRNCIYNSFTPNIIKRYINKLRKSPKVDNYIEYSVTPVTIKKCIDNSVTTAKIKDFIDNSFIPTKIKNYVDNLLLHLKR